MREAARARSSTRWAGRSARAPSTASSAARSSTRWATDMVTIGFVVGLEYRDVELSVHDLLQEFKTHRLVRKILARRRAGRLGREDDHRGRLPRAAEAVSRARAPARGRGRRPRQRAALKGIHYAVESGIDWLRRRRSARSSAASRRAASARSTPTTTRCAGAMSWKDLHEVRNMRQVFDKGFFMGGALASAMTVTKGKLPAEGRSPSSRTPTRTLIRTDRASRYPAPDGKLTFDKLSSVFASGNRTRDDQPNHIRLQRHVPRDLAELWVDVPGAGLRGRALPTATAPSRRRDPVELRPVRRDHRQGRPADSARGRLRARVHHHLGPRRRQASAIAIRCSTEGWLSKSTYDQSGGSGRRATGS